MEKVMIVDDNMANLIMARKTLEDKYEVIPVSSGISALECLNDMPELPVLVLLDIDMPNVNGFQVISEMKNKERLVDIPIIFLTAQDDDITELEGYNLGAADYIRKPYTANLLRKRVDIQIQLINQRKKLDEYNQNLQTSIQEKVKRLAELQYSIVQMFVDVLGKRSHEFSEHAIRVEKYMNVYLTHLRHKEKVDFTVENCATICFASKIHDLGKICIKDRFLRLKEDSYTKLKPFEVGTLQNHTTLGAEIISEVTQLSSGSSNFMTYALNMCKYHHENWDGSGYPDKLTGEKIPLEARILAIVNMYDNLRHNEVDGKVLSHSEAIMKLKFLKFTMLDPELVDEFVACERDIEKLSFD